MRDNKHFYLLPTLLLVITTVTFTGCNSSAAETTSQTSVQTITDISTAEANALIQANKGNPDFIIIDVRTPEEYNEGHLENAILTDYNSGSFSEEIGKLDRNKKYLIYCRTGKRSAGARDIMKDLGFTDVNNMTGGITEWIAQGFPVVK